MYKVLIVDDEVTIRDGLKCKIDWQSQGFDICAEASDGEEALLEMERHEPDVIFTDVRMPVMDGLMLLKECSERFPRLKTVVLSGYDDFSYARTALKYGAKDYLLKPVIRKELIDLLGRLKHELDEERLKHRQQQAQSGWNDQTAHFLREQFLLNLVKGQESRFPAQIRENAARYQLERFLDDGAKVRFLVVEIRHETMYNVHPHRDDLLFLAFYYLIRELCQEWRQDAFVFHDPAKRNLLHLIMNAGDDDRRVAEWVRQTLQPRIKQYLKAESVVGIGSRVSGLRNLREGFQSSLYAWSQSPSGLKSEIIMADHTVKEDPGISPQTEKKITTLLQSLDLPAFESCLNDLLKPDLSIRSLAVRFLKVLFILDSFCRQHELESPEIDHILLGMPDSVWQLQNDIRMKAVLADLASRCIQHVRQTQASGGAQIVGAIKRFLHENYHSSDISLAMLAETFHVNPTYLSEIFKKNTGETYTEYLMNLRINKSLTLLKDPLLRVVDVSELSGFSNPNYFSIVFKKKTGMSPLEYRKWAEPPTNHFEDRKPRKLNVSTPAPNL